MGRATSLLGNNKVEVVIYDKEPSKCSPLDTEIDDLRDCSFVFVCVPTPMNRDGACSIDIVKSCINELLDNGIRRSNIVLRSTVPVGTSKMLGVNFMPEFLTERNWENDFKNCKYWVVGLVDKTSWSDQKRYNDLFYLAKKNKRIN